MERQTCSGLLSVLLLVVFSGDSAHAEVKPVYFGLGQSLNLSLPVATTERLTSLLWKFNDNLLAEWVENVIPLEYYGRFKGRTTLDITTGRLVITNMGKEDIGLYSVEVNNRVQDDKYRATVVEEVPKPEIVVQPLSCSSHSDSCNLNCDGDTTKTGPVTYSWKKGDGAWEVSEKVLNIINNETQKVETFSCRMENLLGMKDSEPRKTNPFFQKLPDFRFWTSVVWYSIKSFGIILLSWAVVYVWRKRETFCPLSETADDTSAQSG
ncbi:SLAM family member 9-like [Anabas testudineus]|uniref:Ig-like domain-containing protein n=1 Tax=Anabas testudineus TaxID=64144 RepID=A0AAQ6IGH7_ANATE|nr:SLAM family member 9-like [Anabas testudineus]